MQKTRVFLKPLLRLLLREAAQEVLSLRTGRQLSSFPPLWRPCPGRTQQWQGLASSTSGLPVCLSQLLALLAASLPQRTPVLLLPSPPPLHLPWLVPTVSPATKPQPWGKDRQEELQARRRKTLREETDSAGPPPETAAQGCIAKGGPGSV